MIKSQIISKMQDEGLLKENGTALDLGFGVGKETFALADAGYNVDAVELDKTKILELQKNSAGLKINFFQDGIQNFPIQEEKYDVIIAKNTLPFIPEKEIVIDLINRMASGLIKGGKIYFTLFGPKDEWSSRKNMSFFSFNEALDVLSNLRLKLYHQSTEEGYGTTMNGDIKFWNIHKFLYIKI